MNYPIQKYSRERYPVTVLIHTGFWMLFIGLELSYLEDLTGKLEPALDYVVYYGLNISLFYGQLWLLNKTFKTPRLAVLKRCLIFLCFLLAYLVLKYYTHQALMYWHYDTIRPIRDLHSFLTAALFRGWSFLFMACFYWAAGHLSAYSRRAKDAEQQQLLLSLEMDKRLAEAENAYLQQQLNPHLLFNTLNFIYTQVYRQSEPAANVVDLLSGIMRFSLEPAGADGKVPLQSELEQVENLIEINAARFDEPLRLQVAIVAEPGNFRIIPLILLTFTENIFKHAHLQDPATPASLTINVDGNNRLAYHSFNRKKAGTTHRQTSSLGLYNARVRLDYAYGDTYTMHINETEDTFQLTLKLPV
jgi:two-component system LytT family sensor kinase